MENVRIRGTGVYIPEHKVYNEEINEHFEQIGLDAFIFRKSKCLYSARIRRNI